MLLLTGRELARIERLCRAHVARERWLRDSGIAEVRRARDLLRSPRVDLRPLPEAVQAAVSIDGSPVGSGITSGSTLDLNITVGNNANRGLALFVHRDSNPEYSSFTLSYQTGSGGAWSAVSGAATNGSNGDGRDVTSYFSAAPSTGSVVVRVTLPSSLTSGDVNAFLFSLHGVDQTTPTSGGVNGFTSTSLTVPSSSGGLALWCVQSNGALTFTGADTSPDITGGGNLLAYGLSAAGTGSNLTVNFSASARGCAAFNVSAAAAGGSMPPPRNQRSRYAALLGF